jgi:hypothetical protein
MEACEGFVSRGLSCTEGIEGRDRDEGVGRKVDADVEKDTSADVDADAELMLESECKRRRG